MLDTCNEPRNHIRLAAKLSMALPPFSLEATLIIHSHRLSSQSRAIHPNFDEFTETCKLVSLQKIYSVKILLSLIEITKSIFKEKKG